ncbi:MAG: methylamine dehydrogenase accessory protein MauD [Burkholderiales bacterium]|nr:methylamine dehydrogenase accessory protein MauD [Burkholderiales bacterium]
MTSITISNALLWVLMLGVIVALWALARQVGILYERVAPMGALITDAGPKLGDASPRFDVPTLAGGNITIGGEHARSQLVFFQSPTCPVCKKLLPILKSAAQAEKSWLEVVLASDGDSTQHLAHYRDQRLTQFPYVLSADLGMTFRVSRLPYAVLLDEKGVIRAKGLINNREQLESLFNAKEIGVASVQDYLQQDRIAETQPGKSA